MRGMANPSARKQKESSRFRFLDQVGQRLTEARAERGLSQRELAAVSGVSTEAVRCFENGTRNPSLGTLHDLAEAMHIEVAELTKRAPPEADPVARLRRALEGQPAPVLEAATTCARAITKAVIETNQGSRSRTRRDRGSKRAT